MCTIIIRLEECPAGYYGLLQQLRDSCHVARFLALCMQQVCRVHVCQEVTFHAQFVALRFLHIIIFQALLLDNIQ